jgi:hypothetical protein
MNRINEREKARERKRERAREREFDDYGLVEYGDVSLG